LLGAHRPETVRLTSPSACPVGVTALALATAIAGGAGWGIELYARRQADRWVGSLSGQSLPFRYQTLTLQRAALASGHVLPIYGSSELRCCGNPFLPTQVFASEPTGFATLALGRAGTADLFFMQTFGALGRDLRGKRVVISDSPPWFHTRRGLREAAYAHNLVPEAAYAFLFEAPISRPVRAAGARRMLSYPETLAERPLLRLAVESLADPTPLHRVEYAAIAPLGHLAARVLEVRDALRTVALVWGQGRLRPPPRPEPAALGWEQLAERGTRIAERRDTSNPFGFPDGTYRIMQQRPRFQRILALYESGRTNRDGKLYPPPPGWRAAMSGSAEWTDLRLALRVLRELGARPLVWTLPLPGAFDDYTPLSVPARQAYYDRYERVARRANVPWLDFRTADEDRWFLTDTGSHLSPRGWVFADRVLDAFWHGEPIDAIRAALETLRGRVPPPPARPQGAGASRGQEATADAR
jgi:poly-D-alanine transfer protein DltD